MRDIGVNLGTIILDILFSMMRNDHERHYFGSALRWLL